MSVENIPSPLPESVPNSSLEAVMTALQEPGAEMQLDSQHPGIIQVTVRKDGAVVASTLLANHPDTNDRLDEVAANAERALRERADAKELDAIMYGISRYMADQIIYAERYEQDLEVLREAGVLPWALLSILNDAAQRVFSAHR